MRHKCLSALVLLVVTSLLWPGLLLAQEVSPAPAGQAAVAPDQPPPAASQPASTPAATAPASTEPAAATSRPKPAAIKISFNFKGASYQQVIDFFSRSTGLPVIWETPVPDGTLEYVAPKAYEVPQALQ